MGITKRRGGIKANFKFLISNYLKIVITKKRSGFSLVEVLVDIVVVSLVATAVITAFLAGYRIIALSKSKIVAVALANERMEEIRNMPYDDLATKTGPIYPQGDLLDEEMITKSSINLRIVTDIRFVDDPFDGNAQGTIPSKPVDIYPYDYKKVTINIYKVGKSGALATLSTNVSGNAAETPTNTGILYLCVIDAESEPVVSANVNITNTELNPSVNISTTTDSTGCIMIPSLPPDTHNHYHLVATKDGFSTDMTYPRTSQNPNALNPDIDIFAQQVANVTLKIDKVGTLNISTVDMTGVPMPNINIHVEGSKEKYFNPQTFKYSEDFTTDGGGHLTLSNMEWDDYKITVTTAGLYLSYSIPTLPIYLAPDTIAEISLRITNSSIAPRIISITPTRGVIPDLTSITVIGENFDNNLTIKLINSTTGAEIIGTDIEVTASKKIIADFDLSLSAIGFYDLLVTNPDGSFVMLVRGFEVVTDGLPAPDPEPDPFSMFPVERGMTNELYEI